MLFGSTTVSAKVRTTLDSVLAMYGAVFTITFCNVCLLTVLVIGRTMGRGEACSTKRRVLLLLTRVQATVVKI